MVKEFLKGLSERIIDVFGDSVKVDINANHIYRLVNEYEVVYRTHNVKYSADDTARNNDFKVKSIYENPNNVKVEDVNKVIEDFVKSKVQKIIEDSEIEDIVHDKVHPQGITSAGFVVPNSRSVYVKVNGDIVDVTIGTSLYDDLEKMLNFYLSPRKLVSDLIITNNVMTKVKIPSSIAGDKDKSKYFIAEFLNDGNILHFNDEVISYSDDGRLALVKTFTVNLVGLFNANHVNSMWFMTTRWSTPNRVLFLGDSVRPTTPYFESHGVLTPYGELEYQDCSSTGRTIITCSDAHVMEHLLQANKEVANAIRETNSRHSILCEANAYKHEDGKYFHVSYVKTIKVLELGFKEFDNTKSAIPEIPRRKIFTRDIDEYVKQYRFNVIANNGADDVLRGVMNYSFKWANAKMVKAKEDSNPDLFYGVEFEFDDGGNNSSNAEKVLTAFTNHKPLMYATSDGSLNDGFEVKTVPMTYDAIMKDKLIDLESGFTVLESLGYTGEDNSTCGLHIHTSKDFYDKKTGEAYLDTTLPVHYYTDLKWLPVYLMSGILENNWDEVVRFTRRDSDRLDRWAGSKFNKDFKKRDVIVKTLMSGDNLNDVLSRQIKRLYENSTEHYSAISIANKQPTIEFRIFRSTLDYKTAVASLQFVRNMVEYSIENSVKIIHMLDSLNKADGEAKAEMRSELTGLIADILTGSLDTIYNYNDSDDFAILKEYANNLKGDK